MCGAPWSLTFTVKNASQMRADQSVSVDLFLQVETFSSGPSASDRSALGLDQSKVALAQRMHASGESTGTIASTLGVSRATVYRALGGDDATGT
jgi:hypothetical protein